MKTAGLNHLLINSLQGVVKVLPNTPKRPPVPIGVRAHTKSSPAKFDIGGGPIIHAKGLKIDIYV